MKLASIEQYLSSSFDGRDKEYRNGELLERGAPDIFHSIVQGWLLWIFNQLAQTRDVFACPEIRLRLGPRLYRIPDIAVFEHGCLPAVSRIRRRLWWSKSSPKTIATRR